MSDDKEPKKKIKIQPVQFALFCDYAMLSVDRKLSAIGIFENFASKGLPFFQPQMSVIVKMLLPQGKHNVTFSLMREDEVLAKLEAEKEIQGKLEPNTHVWNIRGLKIDEWKNLEFQVLIGGKQVFVRHIPVLQLEDPN